MARMSVLTTGGVRDLELASPEDRSIVGSHWNAVQAVLAGKVEQIVPFIGVRVRGYKLLTDLDEIERRGRLGDLEVEPYPSPL